MPDPQTIPTDPNPSKPRATSGSQAGTRAKQTRGARRLSPSASDAGPAQRSEDRRSKGTAPTVHTAPHPSLSAMLDNDPPRGCRVVPPCDVPGPGRGQRLSPLELVASRGPRAPVLGTPGSGPIDYAEPSSNGDAAPDDEAESKRIRATRFRALALRRLQWATRKYADWKAPELGHVYHLKADKLARKLGACKLRVRVGQNGQSTKVTPLLCHGRSCPWCCYTLSADQGWRVAWTMAERIRENPWHVWSDGTHVPRFLFGTLTRRNILGETCDEANERIAAIWAKFRDTRAFRNLVDGGFWRRETERNTRFWHAHLHCAFELVEGTRWRFKADDEDREAEGYPCSRIWEGAASELRRAWFNSGGGFSQFDIMSTECEDPSGGLSDELSKSADYMSKDGLGKLYEAQREGKPIPAKYHNNNWAEWAVSEYGRVSCRFLGSWAKYQAEAKHALDWYKLERLADQLDDHAPEEALTESGEVDQVPDGLYSIDDLATMADDGNETERRQSKRLWRDCFYLLAVEAFDRLAKKVAAYELEETYQLWPKLRPQQPLPVRE